MSKFTHKLLEEVSRDICTAIIIHNDKMFIILSLVIDRVDLAHTHEVKNKEKSRAHFYTTPSSKAPCYIHYILELFKLSKFCCNAVLLPFLMRHK